MISSILLTWMTLTIVSPELGLSGVLETELMEERLLKRLFGSIKCGSCGHNYEVSDIEVLENKGDMWFLRAHCSFCHTQCLVAAIIRGEEVTEVVTDLTEAELAKFEDGAAVEANDLLRVHSFLKDFDGDFSRLFRQGKP